MIFKCFIFRPPTKKSLFYRSRFYANNFRYLIYCQKIAVKLISFCNPSICNLFPVSCPSAIFRGIPFVVVNSVDAMFFTWLASHVENKVFKRIKPSIANIYSASAVILKRCISFVGATLNNCCPSIVFKRVSKSVCFHIFGHGDFSYFCIKAPARFNVSFN